ncbi:tetratricopeptide repeat protein [Aquimarina sp. Aq107]|uniref:tetratricopeptide repeat protein n=1 Tax=Aquimarina sp. Aq107 TaxID=1191912 RepID=UPI000D5548B1|nr:tetratricopeptide repeat protein [Aquimarina sp. Aq107]
MNIKFLLLFLIIILSSCGQNGKTNKRDTNEIEYVSNSEIVGGFDREKYPILQEAILLKEDNSLTEAIEKFNIAEKEYGPMIPIYLNRGVVYQQMGKSKESITDFEKCLSLNNEYYAALINRGIAYVYSNQSEKALIDLDKAIEINPTEPATYLNRAIAYNDLGKTKLACSDYKKAKSLGLMDKYGSDSVPRWLKIKCVF